ncbi:33 kDa chaperonin [Saliniradius amylolyticus]|uniref:33 kDa chaperonin n=1 Tax=Saliniradius amylolyticus TaxID=2183582 RepID=A0A2S2DZC4_9ALTE|nr:Hsp33 family molecular chaperone HslO [Saliniradius amylolyticus]AWL10632.1 33 kDa chaperonin [Saliniradius amylolyticus]
MKDAFDHLYRYLFDDLNVRGELVRLHDSYQQILSAQDYPEPIQRLLGELMAATSLLTATLKFEGDIAVQIQSEGPVQYAVINGTQNQELRGVARWQGQVPDNFSEMFVKGYLAITITPKEGERYQGVVPLDKPSLAQCLESYFEQSEQLATQVNLFVDLSARQAGGLLLQVLPVAETAKQDFEHLAKLTETMTDKELFSLPVTEVLHRLYHEQQVQLFEPQPVMFKCSCSKERSAAALESVDKDELLQIVAEQGTISMNCQYCHAEYRFDAIDVEAIHAGTFTSEPTPQ